MIDQKADPLGNAVGVGCHNCRHEQTDNTCNVRLWLWDDLDRISDDNGNYVARLHDYCPDWHSRYVHGFTVVNLRHNARSNA
jgi:hypothetical protein